MFKESFFVDKEKTFDFKRKEKYTWECLRENLETKPGGGGLHSTPLVLCACSIQGKWRTALAPMTWPPNPHSSTNCPLIFSAAFSRLMLVLFFVCLLLLLLLDWGSVQCSTGGRWPGRPEGGKWRKSNSSKAKSSVLLLKYSSKPSCSLFRENCKYFYGVKKTFFS